MHARRCQKSVQMLISRMPAFLHAILNGTAVWLPVRKRTLIVCSNVILEVEIALVTVLVWKTVRTDAKFRNAHTTDP